MISHNKFDSIPESFDTRDRDQQYLLQQRPVIPSQVEMSVLRHPEVHGGSVAAATVADLGFEPTLGATSADAKPRRARTNTIEVGEVLSAAGVSAA